MICEVLRPFQATNDELLEPGPPGAPRLVETGFWREANVARLIQRRYLRPVPLLPLAPQGPSEEDGAPLPEVSAERMPRGPGHPRTKPIDMIA